MGENIEILDNVLWFCKTGDTSSLSRITDSVLPILRKNFNVTLLSNRSKLEGIKNVIIGTDCIATTYAEFMKAYPKANNDNIRGINLKYILVQIVDLIFENDYKYLVICNGIYEIDWITKMLTSNPMYLKNSKGNKTKLIVWSPIDYIPNNKIIENVVKSDLFITMTPIMKEKVIELFPGSSVNWVGHGSDIISLDPDLNIEKEIQQMHKDEIIRSAQPIYSSDIIILNANNFWIDKNNSKTRKRFDITFKAFIELLSKLDPETAKITKLWIHTNLESFFEMLSIEGISIKPYINNLIFSRNTMTNKQLASMYKFCKISLQTSVSEGWSLTNMEAAVYGSLQIVPDFLACGYHFKNDRGLLIPITENTIKIESGEDVTVGEVSITDTCDKLLIGIGMIKDGSSRTITDNAKEYAESYTWENVTSKLIMCMRLSGKRDIDTFTDLIKDGYSAEEIKNEFEK
jgi:predicted transcriptional regulator